MSSRLFCYLLALRPYGAVVIEYELSVRASVNLDGLFCNCGVSGVVIIGLSPIYSDYCVTEDSEQEDSMSVSSLMQLSG